MRFRFVYKWQYFQLSIQNSLALRMCFGTYCSQVFVILLDLNNLMFNPRSPNKTASSFKTLTEIWSIVFTYGFLRIIFHHNFGSNISSLFQVDKTSYNPLGKNSNKTPLGQHSLFFNSLVRWQWRKRYDFCPICFHLDRAAFYAFRYKSSWSISFHTCGFFSFPIVHICRLWRTVVVVWSGEKWPTL